MLATPPERVRGEVRRAYAHRPLPAVLQPFDEDPRPRVAALADLFRAYWERALAPHWPRIRALLEGDVLLPRAAARRRRRAAAVRRHPPRGCASPTTRCFIDMPFEVTADLGGRGLLFVPSAFTWPRPAASVEPPGSRSRLPGARRSAALWEPAAPRRRRRSPRCSAPPRGVLAALARPALDHRAGARARALPRQRLPAPVGAPRRRPRQRPPRRPRSVLYVRSATGRGARLQES